MINNLYTPNIRLFVFGTLRVSGRLQYYMEGSSPMGLFYTKGQLMESENGSAYIDFDVTDAATIGEVHHVNFFCLQRINHLESNWGDFPKAYHLGLIPVWNFESPSSIQFNDAHKSYALCYKWRGPSKVPGGDWLKRKSTMEELEYLLKEESEVTLYYNDVLNYISKYLGMDE